VAISAALPLEAAHPIPPVVLGFYHEAHNAQAYTKFQQKHLAELLMIQHILPAHFFHSVPLQKSGAV